MCLVLWVRENINALESDLKPLCFQFIETYPPKTCPCSLWTKQIVGPYPSIKSHDFIESNESQVAL